MDYAFSNDTDGALESLLIKVAGQQRWYLEERLDLITDTMAKDMARVLVKVIKVHECEMEAMLEAAPANERDTIQQFPFSQAKVTTWVTSKVGKEELAVIWEACNQSMISVVRLT